MAQETAVSIRGMAKFYGRFQVLHDIDLDVACGEKVIVCGPSGSGKSTLIRCINRLEEHQRGTIRVLDHELNDDTRNIDAIRRDVGMVFQNFNLFPHLTVMENCTLAPVRVRRLAREEAEERAMAFLRKARIAELVDRYPGQLSGGQQQRAAIARALCMQPSIMLFDEPTSALDPETICEVLDVMEQLAADGMTMICVTHEMGFARKVADRIVFMDAGRVVEEAAPATFFEAPRSARAREFLSSVLGEGPRPVR